MIKGRKNRILIIDDNQEIHNDIKKILLPPVDSSELDALVKGISGHSASEEKTFDIQIDSALQGDEGMEMVRQAKLDGNPYALAFVDMRIPPGLDGVQTIKQLQQIDERLQYVIITAYSDYSLEDIDTELSPGDNLFIIKKPFESIEIRQSANTFLEKWHLTRERNRAVEELIHSKKIEMIGFMANGIAHDFNNLLMGIQGNIDLAAMDLPEEHPSRDSLENACEVIQTSKELIQKFLIFSEVNRPRKGKIPVRRVVDYAREKVLSGANVSCEFSQAEDLWLADVDPYQMKHVLLELFSNAKEAMADGGKINVHVENVHIAPEDGRDREHDKYVRITIHDHGRGIKEEEQANIFDPYYSTKPRGVERGMGLGLALVAAIVKQHEGRVHVDSVPGKGTKVIIELPAADQLEPEQ